MNIRNRKELIKHIHHGNKVKYVFFWGHTNSSSSISKSCFSQWYDSPFKVDGKQFLTAEHYMMYRKALLFDDQDTAEKLLKASDPGKAKALGRQVKDFDNEVWFKHRFEIVVSGNLAKFNSNPELRNFLLNTGKKVLVEASPSDKIWGIGLAEGDDSSSDPKKWLGENLLGFALMEVRSILNGK